MILIAKLQPGCCRETITFTCHFDRNDCTVVWPHNWCGCSVIFLSAPCAISTLIIYILKNALNSQAVCQREQRTPPQPYPTSMIMNSSSEQHAACDHLGVKACSFYWLCGKTFLLWVFYFLFSVKCVLWMCLCPTKICCLWNAPDGPLILVPGVKWLVGVFSPNEHCGWLGF